MSERECSFTNIPLAVLTPFFEGGGGSVLFMYKPRHYPQGSPTSTGKSVLEKCDHSPNYGGTLTSFLMKASSLVAGPSPDTRLPGEGVPGRKSSWKCAGGWLLRGPCPCFRVGTVGLSARRPCGGGAASVGKEGPLGRRGECVSALCPARTPLVHAKTHLETVCGTWQWILITRGFIKSGLQDARVCPGTNFKLGSGPSS